MSGRAGRFRRPHGRSSRAARSLPWVGANVDNNFDALLIAGAFGADRGWFHPGGHQERSEGPHGCAQGGVAKQSDTGGHRLRVAASASVAERGIGATSLRGSRLRRGWDVHPVDRGDRRRGVGAPARRTGQGLVPLVRGRSRPHGRWRRRHLGNAGLRRSHGLRARGLRDRTLCLLLGPPDFGRIGGKGSRRWTDRAPHLRCSRAHSLSSRCRTSSSYPTARPTTAGPGAATVEGYGRARMKYGMAPALMLVSVGTYSARTSE